MTQQTEPIVEGGEKVTTHWWVAAPTNLWQYHVHVVRDHQPYPVEESDGTVWASWQEYLDSEGSWHVLPLGGACEPALVLSERLIMAMGEHGPINRDNVVVALEALATSIFKRVARDTEAHAG